MFQGFSQNAIDFLWGISLNNERGWFMAHKQDFTDYVDIPMRELGKEAFSALAEEYPKQDWRLHVCRIYRDARRLHVHSLWSANNIQYRPCPSGTSERT